MIENVSTQLTVFHCFAHCLLPGRAFASLYALLFLEKEAEIGGRDRLEIFFVLDERAQCLVAGPSPAVARSGASIKYALECWLAFMHCEI